MVAVRTAVLACLLLAACDGNPFLADGGDPDPTGNPSVSTLRGTTNPSAASGITRQENRDLGPDMEEVYGNGFAEGYSYDLITDTFTVDNLAFDGGNVYERSDTFPTVGPAAVYAGSLLYEDEQTQEQIDQFSYRALYGVSTTGRTSFAIVRTGSYVPFGFGGFIYSRDGGVVLPTSGQARYDGTYAGLRDFNGRGGMQITSGDMTMAIDFNDFNPDEGGTGNGAGIKGRVTNRKVFDLNGNDITASVLAEINADKNPDFDLTALPTLLFKVGPGVLDNNGEAEGQLDSTIISSGKAEGFEDGKYYVVIAGNRADEAAGVIVVTSDIGGVTVRETGGFILYRP
jgi:hypothetical protein